MTTKTPIKKRKPAFKMKNFYIQDNWKLNTDNLVMLYLKVKSSGFLFEFKVTEIKQGINSFGYDDIKHMKLHDGRSVKDRKNIYYKLSTLHYYINKLVKSIETKSDIFETRKLNQNGGSASITISNEGYKFLFMINDCNYHLSFGFNSKDYDVINMMKEIVKHLKTAITYYEENLIKYNANSFKRMQNSLKKEYPELF